MQYTLESPVKFDMLMDFVSHGLDPNIKVDTLSYGADYNVRDERGRTAIILAIEAGHVTCVRHLLSYGADIYLEDNNGLNALDHACRQNTGELKNNDR